MSNWVLGEPGASSKPDSGEILHMISLMDSETIRQLVQSIWLIHDEAVLRETGKLYNLGAGDHHWEGHL